MVKWTDYPERASLDAREVQQGLEFRRVQCFQKLSAHIDEPGLPTVGRVEDRDRFDFLFERFSKTNH